MKRIKKINKPPDGCRKLNMQKFSVEGTVHLIKSKIPKYRGPNERNAKRRSTTVIFHSRQREET